jgi:hypothetical protein
VVSAHPAPSRRERARRHPQGTTFLRPLRQHPVHARGHHPLPRLVPPSRGLTGRRVDPRLRDVRLGPRAAQAGCPPGQGAGVAARPGRAAPVRARPPEAHGRGAHRGDHGRRHRARLLPTVPRPVVRPLRPRAGPRPPVREVHRRSPGPAAGHVPVPGPPRLHAAGPGPAPAPPPTGRPPPRPRCAGAAGRRLPVRRHRPGRALSAGASGTSNSPT